MHIREYQRWLEEWDEVRTWDKVLPSHTLLHAMEETGRGQPAGADVGRISTS